MAGNDTKSKAILVSRVLEAFSEKADAFARAAGVACLPGCGDCCTNPRVEATVLEMLPAAFALMKEGGAEALLRELVPRESLCAFFRPGGTSQEGHALGRCARYFERPLVCRQFGASVRRHQGGGREFLACGPMKAHAPGMFQGVTRYLEEGANMAPAGSDVLMDLVAIDPSLAVERRPLNQALALALERVLLWESYARESDSEHHP
jgi:Fe-S-cluster containining protein